MRSARIAAVAASLAWFAAAQNAPGTTVTSNRAPYPINNSSIIGDPTVSAAPAPSAAELTCPESNNTGYTAPSGARFLIECELDHYGGDMAMATTSSFQQCIDFCDGRAGCVDVSYQGSACYMKATVGRPIHSRTVLGARLIWSPAGIPEIPVCPMSNGANYTTSRNSTFVIECGIDYATSINEDNLAVINVSQEGESDTFWFQRCIETCGATRGCVNVSLSGNSCHLKSSIEGARRMNDPNILSARLIDPVPWTPPAPTRSTTQFVPPAPTSTAVVCPAANATTYYATSGGVRKAFVIECGVDYASTGGDLIGGPNDLPGTNVRLWLSQCIDLCASTTNCVNIALNGAACYLKSNINGRTPISRGPEFGGARLVPARPATTVVVTPIPATTTPPSPPPAATTIPAAVCALQTTSQCPACNSRTIFIEDEEYSNAVGYRGVAYRVQCGVEYIGSNMGSPLSGYSGARGYRRCVETCFYAEGCVAVAFSGSVCQLKSAVEAGARANAAIWGAVDLDVLFV